jgi:hypothetical protein
MAQELSFQIADPEGTLLRSLLSALPQLGQPSQTGVPIGKVEHDAL